MKDPNEKTMGVMGRMTGIFSSPTETFQDIDAKPTWLAPYLVIVLFVIAMQFLVMDIGIQDRIAMMETQDIPPERMEMARRQMAGPMRYIGLVMIPIVSLIIWSVIAGVLMLGGNHVMGGKATFKKVFSVIAWSGLVSLIGGVLKTALVLTKGTSHGVTISAAAAWPVPPEGESPSLMYVLLSKLDPFTIWEMVLWAIGLAVVSKIETRKSYYVISSVWILWIAVSLALRNMFGGMFGG